MEKLQTYLELNGKIIIFLNKDGVYWIALKPICEALSVDFHEQNKDVKSDPILGAEWCNHTMQVPGQQARKYFCLPEEFIYGWLFSIKSKSPELIEYKRKCYHLLYTYFHGTITQRQSLLVERNNINDEIATLTTNLSSNEDFVRMNSLVAKRMRMEKDLKKLDELLASGQTRMEF